MFLPRALRVVRRAPPSWIAQRFSSSSFLHVGPSGDCWVGSSIFAAKHLQPDYVKSIPLPPAISVDSLLEKLEHNPKLSQQVYDTGKIPSDLLLAIKDDGL